MCYAGIMRNHLIIVSFIAHLYTPVVLFSVLFSEVGFALALFCSHFGMGSHRFSENSQILRKLLLYNMVWLGWVECNRRILENKDYPRSSLFEKLKLTVIWWSLICKEFTGIQEIQLRGNWSLILLVLWCFVMFL